MKINLKTLSEYMLYVYIIALPYLAIVYPNIADAIFIGFILITTIIVIRGGIDRRVLYRTGIFIIVLLAITIITSMMAENKETAYSGSWTLIQLLIFDFFLMITIDSDKVIIGCLKSFVIGTYTMMLFVFTQTGVQLLSVLPTWRFGGGDGSINVNSIGAAAGWSVLILFLFYKQERKKFFLYLMLPPMLFVFGSASRASLLIVLFGICIYYLTSKQKASYVKLALAIFLLVLGYNIVESLNLFPDFISRFNQLLAIKNGVDSTDGSTRVRYQIVLYGIEKIKERPWLGYGLGQFHYIFQDEALAPHNTFIQIAYAFGLVGAVWWYGNIAVSAFRIFSYSNSHVFRWIAVINTVLVCMGISAQSLTDKTAHLFLILLFNSDVLLRRQSDSEANNIDELKS